jgi:hypothetical protein
MYLPLITAALESITVLSQEEVRHEALVWFRMGVKDHPSLSRRSGW